MKKFAPIDARGKKIEIGDWVRVVKIPPDVAGLSRDTRSIFRRALGKTFKIESFNRYGVPELDVSKKVEKLNFIWVEPEYLILFRRKRQP